MLKPDPIEIAEPIGPRYIRTSDAAHYICSTKSTLEKLRVIGGGPTFSKLGRTVVYDIVDLDDWVASNRQMSTSDTQANRAA